MLILSSYTVGSKYADRKHWKNKDLELKKDWVQNLIICTAFFLYFLKSLLYQGKWNLIDIL